MTTTPLRIGLVGVSHRAALARFWDEDERAQVVAGADIVETYLDRFRGQYAHNDPWTTSDWRELVARKDLDVIGVFTPDNLHAEPVVAALEAGKHVFSEKPMAISVADCDRMLAAWRASGKRLMVGHNMRYSDAFLTLRDVVQSGRLGEVHAVWVRHFVGMGGWYYFHDYRANRRGSNTLLLQKGSHDLDMIHFLTGRKTLRVTAMGALDYYGGDKPNDLHCAECPEQFSCPDFSAREGKTHCCYRQEVDVEDHSLVLLDLGDVRAAYLQCHYAAVTDRNYVLMGSNGQAELTGHTITVTTHKGNAGKAHSISTFAAATYQVGTSAGGHGGADPRLCRAFLDYVLDGVEPLCRPEDGRLAVAVGCAAAESLRNGCVPVCVP